MSELFQDWDDFHIKKGDRVSFKALDGTILTGIVQDIQEDKETGEIRLAMDDNPNPGPGWESLIR